MSQSNFSPAKLAIESAAIFFSVILAFAVDQWREDRNERQQATATLNLVRAELQQNLTELQTIVPQRAGQLDAYIEAIGILTEENRFPQNLPQFTSPDITTIAYDLATDSGAVTKVDPAELIVIARAYKALQIVIENDDFLNQRNAQIRFNDGEQYLSGFIYYLNRAIVDEPSAIEHVEAAIATLDASSQG